MPAEQLDQRDQGLARGHVGGQGNGLGCGDVMLELRAGTIERAKERAQRRAGLRRALRLEWRRP
jgi:hypothetical protein